MARGSKFLNCFFMSEPEDVDEEDAYRRLDSDQFASSTPLIDDNDDGDTHKYYMAADLGRFKKTRSNANNRRQLSDTFMDVDHEGLELQTKLKRNQMRLKLNHMLLYTWHMMKKAFLLTVPGIASMFMFTAPTSSLFKNSESKYRDVDPSQRTKWI